jgi:ubiquinone/menaquinone biosynthesis C-methylase UbiE
MTTTAVTPKLGLASRLVNGILAIKPLANFAKHKARQMMIDRAEKIGVTWRDNVVKLRSHNWEEEIELVRDSNLIYPDYYLTSFHAYEKGNLSWDAALEVESAAHAVHATIWGEANIEGDAKLRQSYHDVIKAQLSIEPQAIVDLGCSVGMSTFALQKLYPHARVSGVDLSPYFLAVANYRSREKNSNLQWVHAAAEKTGLPTAAYDLVSACLMFHELPQAASRQIFVEARRLLRAGGYLTIMDMNPRSSIYAKMPPYVLTLLKSTEPYLDSYFALDIETAIQEAGFEAPVIVANTPRHRSIVARVKN